MLGMVLDAIDNLDTKVRVAVNLSTWMGNWSTESLISAQQYATLCDSIDKAPLRACECLARLQR
jgi:hypothetical protein